MNPVVNSNQIERVTGKKNARKGFRWKWLFGRGIIQEASFAFLSTVRCDIFVVIVSPIFPKRRRRDI